MKQTTIYFAGNFHPQAEKTEDEQPEKALKEETENRKPGRRKKSAEDESSQQSKKENMLRQKLSGDYRAALLGDASLLEASTESGADPELTLAAYPVAYGGGFYEAQTGKTLNCDDILDRKIKQIRSADIFCCVFDTADEADTVLELTEAVKAGKQIVIFYRKQADSPYSVKSSYGLAIARALQICRTDHTQAEAYGYDDSVLPHLYNWLNNLIFTKRYVCVRREELEKTMEAAQLIHEYRLGRRQVKHFGGEKLFFAVETYDSGLIIVKTAEPVGDASLIDVTEIPLYTDEGIRMRRVVAVDAALEGTNGVGKTVTVNRLILEGIVCEDRLSAVSEQMLSDIPAETRCEAIAQYLEEHPEKRVIFLVNRSKEELEARVGRRIRDLVEFGQDVYAGNQLYEETFEALGDCPCADRVELLDCTGMTIEEQVNAVKVCILQG